ncbi:MAG: HAD-IB family phosphatase, partial [Thermoleophilia bacterium]|nr:HAD-IB family phosphatase [Thermoleophilia bacterium]
MHSGPDSGPERTERLLGCPPERPRFFIACDFDGTITERDTLDLVVRRYAPGVWDSVEVRLRAGEIDLSEAMREEFDHVRAREADVVAHVLAEAGVRRGFREFVRWIEDEGHRLLVVSAGFRSLIDPVLAAAGLSHLHVHAGD